MTTPASPWDEDFFRRLADVWDRHEVLLDDAARPDLPRKDPGGRPYRTLVLRKLGFRLGGDGIGSLMARFVFRSWSNGEMPVLDTRFVELDHDAVDAFEREIQVRMLRKGILVSDCDEDLQPPRSPWGKVTRSLVHAGCLQIPRS